MTLQRVAAMTYRFLKVADERYRVRNLGDGASASREKPAGAPSLTVNDDAVYLWLTNYFLHQDQLSWSRTQTMVVVEAAVLSAAFYLNGRASVLPLVLGTGVICLVWTLVRRDWLIRDQDLRLLDTVHERLGIRVTKNPAKLSGKRVAELLVGLVVMTNIVTSALFLCVGSREFLEW